MSSKTKTTATKEEAKPALVPKLRFPEFRKAEGWAQEPLGGVASFFKGKGLPKSALTPDGKRPCIHYGELFTVYPEVIGAVRSRTNSEEDVFLSVENDVLMPTSDVTPSGLAKACCLNSENVLLGGDILVIRTDKRSINGEFLARYIRHLERKVLQLVSGSTVFHLYASSMEKLVLSFPPERAEQQKIAGCLNSVDELIAVQARKLDALKTHKKGLMQQLFPRDGETQPRLRFPEFQHAGEWESATLENLCSAKISYGIVQAGPHVPNGMPYIKSTDLNSKLCLANLARTSEAIAQKYRRSEVVPGDIVFSLRGNIGVAQILPIGIPVANLTQGTARIRTKAAPEFYFHALRSPSVNSRIQAVGKGSTFQEVSLETLRNVRLLHPEPAEQKRIASCLSSLDALVTAEAQKLETLRTHKRGLMQQLFPSPEEPNP
jgi:type I restriction enzyme S subunit